MTFDNLRWVKAHGHDITHLTAEEADELDTLQFRRSTDLPFGLDAEFRYLALIAKGRGDPEPVVLNAKITGDNLTLTEGNITASTIQFVNQGKPVLTITKDGELEFSNATEAALALKAEWDRLRGEA